MAFLMVVSMAQAVDAMEMLVCADQTRTNKQVANLKAVSDYQGGKIAEALSQREQP